MFIPQEFKSEYKFYFTDIKEKQLEDLIKIVNSTLLGVRILSVEKPSNNTDTIVWFYFKDLNNYDLFFEKLKPVLTKCNYKSE